MAYQKQTWRDYDDTKTELVNMGQGAVVTPERMNHIETGIANSANKAEEVTAQLANKIGGGVKAELEDMSPTVISAIEGGEGTEFNLLSIPQDKSVTPKKTTFFDVSNNLFDRNNVTLDTNITNDTGEIVPSIYGDATTNSFIDVAPGNKYSFKQLTRIAQYDKNGNFIARHSPSYGAVPIVENYTMPNNVYKVRFQTTIENVPTAQFNEGSKLLPYDEYKMNIPSKFLPKTEPPKEGGEGTESILQDKSVTPKKTTFFDISNNLFDRNNVTLDTNITNDTGEIVPSIYGDATTNSFIDVAPGNQYSFKQIIRIAQYDKNGNFIARYSPNYGAVPIVENYTMPNNVYKVRFQTTIKNVPTAQFNEGSKLLPYDEYKMNIPGKFLPKIELPKEDTVSKIKNYFAPTHDVGIYKSAPGETFDTFRSSTKLIDYQSAWHTLATSYPDYITETLMGVDSSGLYNVYQYRLNYPGIDRYEGRYNSEAIKKKPKIIITSGMHGDEYTSTYSVYALAKRLCTNWKENEVLEYLRFNVEFVVVPLVNPWGHENTSRFNVNGIDLGRNFPTEFAPGGAGGTVPLSEVESTYIKEILDENKGALFYIDYHSSNLPYTTNAESLFYGFMPNNKYLDRDMETIQKYTMEKMTREFIKNYDQPDNVGEYGYMEYSGIKGYGSMYAKSIGIPSLITETAGKLPSEEDWGDVTITQVAAETFINLLMTGIRHFESKYYGG